VPGQHCNASTPHGGGTIRWAAPEFLDVFSGERKKQTPTVESDTHALSMVIIEVGGFLPIKLNANVHALSLAVHWECSFRQQSGPDCRSLGAKG